MNDDDEQDARLREAERQSWREEARYETVLPRALVKALSDPFIYALGLRTGQVIAFSLAHWEFGDLWVHLEFDSVMVAESHGHWPIQDVQIPFDRGLDVRLSDIVWVADAPWGS